MCEAEEHRVGVCHLPLPPTIGYPGLRLAVGGAYVRSSSPFFVLYHRLYRVSQIDDSIRPTKPITILHISFSLLNKSIYVHLLCAPCNSNDIFCFILTMSILFVIVRK